MQGCLTINKLWIYFHFLCTITARFILYTKGKKMSIQCYADKKWLRWFNKETRNQYMRDVKINGYKNGIIVNEKLHGFGVFDENFHFVKSASQVRKNNGNFYPKFNHENIPYIDADAVFVGNVYNQFGHFLLEHMNRAYAALDKKCKDMKYVLINNKSVSPVPEYMFTFLELLGIKRENIIILEKTTRFRNVYVPDQGFNIPVYSSVKFGETFDKIAKNVENPNEIFDKIYVSRARLKSRKTYGEERVQTVFERNGFKIIYPETLPLVEQISLIKGCKVLAGCAGTALHMALFMKPGGTVVQIKRNGMVKDNAPTQYLINKTKNLNSVFINSSVENVKTDHCSDRPQIIGIDANMTAFFKDFDFKTNAKDFYKDTDAFAEYETALRQYQSLHGTSGAEKVKHLIVRITSCFIPGRYNRSVYRRWLKGKLGIC